MYFGESKWLQGDIYWASKRGIFRLSSFKRPGIKMLDCSMPKTCIPLSGETFLCSMAKTVLRSRTQPDQASRAGEGSHISVPEQLPLTTPHSDDDNNNNQSCKGVLRMLSPSTFVLTSLGVVLPYHRSVNLCIVATITRQMKPTSPYGVLCCIFTHREHMNNISMNFSPADGVLEFAVTQPAGVKPL